jgi:hypothetical protein
MPPCMNVLQTLMLARTELVFRYWWQWGAVSADLGLFRGISRWHMKYLFRNFSAVLVRRRALTDLHIYECVCGNKYNGFFIELLPRRETARHIMN